jgi:diguanylate cyclase (GGDEF)-like protein
MADRTSLLVPVMQMLVLTQELGDVRRAIAHGARVVAHHDALTLYERSKEGGELETTLRSGAELAPGSLAVEELLAAKAAKTGTTMSTLDFVADPREQERLLEHLRNGRLCIARPLRAFDELVGVLVLHDEHRTSLDEGEFDNLRRLCSFAAAALSSAKTRADLDGYAHKDALTGLANRRRLESEMARLDGSPLAVLLIDFDGLKAVNDSLGYDEGDNLIASIGAKLAAIARPGETVVRYGGDEFVIVMEGAGESAARARRDEVTDVLDRLPVPPAVVGLFKGASVGWATAEKGSEAPAALARAQNDMKSSKRRRKTDRELGLAGESAAV